MTLYQNWRGFRKGGEAPRRERAEWRDFLTQGGARAARADLGAEADHHPEHPEGPADRQGQPALPPERPAKPVPLPAHLQAIRPGSLASTSHRRTPICRNQRRLRADRRGQAPRGAPRGANTAATLLRRGTGLAVARGEGRGRNILPRGPGRVPVDSHSICLPAHPQFLGVQAGQPLMAPRRGSTGPATSAVPEDRRRRGRLAGHGGTGG